MISSRRWQDQEGTPDERRADRRASRRTFVDWLLGTGLGSLLVTVLYPPIRFLVPPKSSESAAASVVLPFAPEDIPPDSGRIFKFGSQPGMLVRTSGGDLRAFSAVCTHLGCIVQYRPDLHHIWCACHNGHFDLNGVNVAGPPPRPLERFSVNIRGDRIVVERSS